MPAASRSCERAPSAPATRRADRVAPVGERDRGRVGAGREPAASSSNRVRLAGRPRLGAQALDEAGALDVPAEGVEADLGGDEAGRGRAEQAAGVVDDVEVGQRARMGRDRGPGAEGVEEAHRAVEERHRAPVGHGGVPARRGRWRRRRGRAPGRGSGPPRRHRPRRPRRTRISEEVSPRARGLLNGIGRDRLSPRPTPPMKPNAYRGVSPRRSRPRWCRRGGACTIRRKAVDIGRPEDARSMSLFIALLALGFLMFVAYRGYSVILFAPVAALGAVLLTDPALVRADVHRPVHGQDGRLPEAVLPGVPARRGVRQADRAVGLLRVHRRRGHRAGRRASARCSSIVLVCALLTYGGVSLFVVVFAVYPVRRGAVPPERHPQAPDPRHHRARRVHLHHGRAARHAADPEHHPDHLLRHHSLGRARGSGTLGARVHPRASAWPTSSGAARRGRAPARAMATGHCCNEPAAVRRRHARANPCIALLPLVWSA